MTTPLAEIAERLAERAEAVCQHYLSNGRRAGNYWQVGDILNTPGQSLYVRLTGGARGRWTDGATGEHGDLLDLIRLAKGLHPSVAEALKEARDFLNMPRSLTPSPKAPPHPGPMTTLSPGAKTFSWSKPIYESTLAETYLNGRGIVIRGNYRALRFHPSCYVQNETTHATEQWPALIAAITDGDGSITAIQRTYLNRDGQGKAPFENPRRSLGLIQGHGIRLGWTKTKTCLSVGEGLESMLSLRQLLPGMPAIAATSAAHVALFHIPRHVQRLYIATDSDEAGDHAAEVLTKRVEEDGNCQVLRLRAVRKDFNDDLCQLPRRAALANLADQLAQEDKQYLGR